MSFLYYIPKANTELSYDLLCEYGLSHIVDNPRQALHCRQVLSNHPSGYPGLVLAAADRCDAESVKQSPDVQWVKFPLGHATQQAWLGWRQLPGEADLIRTHHVNGERMLLADGNEWLIPIARRANGTCALPICYDIDEETGNWIPSRVRREYEKLWNHALKCFELLCASNGTFDIEDFETLVSDVMQVNYRVSTRELAALGLLDTAIANKLVSVILDFKGAEALKVSDE